MSEQVPQSGESAARPYRWLREAEYLAASPDERSVPYLLLGVLDGLAGIEDALRETAPVAANNEVGVWLTYDYDNGPYAISLHSDAIAAAREAAQRGYGKVGFWPFGMDLADAVKRWEDPRHSTRCDGGRP